MFVAAALVARAKNLTENDLELPLSWALGRPLGLLGALPLRILCARVSEPVWHAKHAMA